MSSMACQRGPTPNLSHFDFYDRIQNQSLFDICALFLPLPLSLSHSLCVKSLKEVRESLVFSNDEWKMIHLACCKSLFAFEHNWVLTISSIIDSCLLLQCGSLFNLDRIKFSYIYLILFFNKSKCIAQHII